VSSRDQYLELHKVSFIVWAVFAGLHVLAHLPGIPASLRAGGRGRRSAEDLSPGSRGRWLALTGALIGGLVLALALLPDFVSWTARGAMAHHGLH
jgi:hypothetical protein